MVKGRGKRKRKSVPVKEDISDLEKEALSKAKAVIGAIDRFVSKWDSGKVKPERMRPEVKRVRALSSSLKGWRKEAEKGERSEEQKARSMGEFIRICWQYS